MSGGCIHTPVHKYDCWNHGGGACVEKGEDICSGCLSIARTSGQDAERKRIRARALMLIAERRQIVAAELIIAMLDNEKKAGEA
jgi:hypothetical protein